MSSRFEGTTNYIATDGLKVAVNAAVALERPLLIKGEPGWDIIPELYPLASEVVIDKPVRQSKSCAWWGIGQL